MNIYIYTLNVLFLSVRSDCDTPIQKVWLNTDEPLVGRICIGIVHCGG